MNDSIYYMSDSMKNRVRNRILTQFRSYITEKVGRDTQHTVIDIIVGAMLENVYNNVHAAVISEAIFYTKHNKVSDDELSRVYDKVTI